VVTESHPSLADNRVAHGLKSNHNVMREGIGKLWTDHKDSHNPCAFTPAAPEGRINIDLTHRLHKQRVQPAVG
jgi:hypothetical protein